MNTWTRDQILMAIGILVALIVGISSCVVSISHNEIRTFIGPQVNTSESTASPEKVTEPPVGEPTDKPVESALPGIATPTQAPPSPKEEDSTSEHVQLELNDGVDCSCPELLDEVKVLQTLLNKQGFSLEVDGLFGFETEDAVKQFQAEHHLNADGIAGSETWAALLDK